MINCLIIEDEPQACNTLKLMLHEYFPDIRVLNEFDKVSLAVDYLKKNPVHFVFLDVQLNGEIGLDITKYINKDALNFDIIFTTAYSDYAIEAFALCAIDYLLKPINPERFKEAVNRVIKKHKIDFEQLNILHQISDTHTIERIVLKNNDGNHIIQLQNILYLKAANSYTEFYLTNGKRIVVSKLIKEYNMLLSQKAFFKPHRSFIINTNYITSYQKGELVIILNHDIKISLSRDKKKEFEGYLLDR